MIRPSLYGIALLLAASCLAQETYQVIPLRPDPPIAIDGDLGEWGQVANPITISKLEQVQVSPDKWRGVEDLSATVRLASRQEGLLLSADVLDQVVSQPGRSANLWKGDHIELFIDAMPDADTNRTTWGDGQFQIALSPGNFRTTGDALVDVKPEAYAYRPEGLDVSSCVIAARRTLQGYALEALVPFPVLGISAPRQGLPISLEVALSDCDSPEGAQEKYMTIGTARWAHSRTRLLPALLGDALGKAQPPARRSPIRR